MGIQFVPDEPYTHRIRIAFVEHAFDPPCPIRFGPAFGYLNVPPVRKGFHFKEDLCDSIADVFVVDSSRFPGFTGERVACFADGLFAGFVHADDGVLWIIG